DLGHIGREAPLCSEFGIGHDAVALDQGVAKQAGGNFLHVGHGEAALEQVLHRVVDTVTVGEGTSGQIGYRLAGGTADVVGNAGTEADFHGKIEASGKGPVNAPFLNDR